MIRRRRIPWSGAVVLSLLLVRSALGHAGDDEVVPQSYGQLVRAWDFDPGIVIPLILSAWLYVQGMLRMPRVRKVEAACFFTGWISLVVALVSPVHPWGRALFSVHMAQHEILMLIAAPLLVLGRPVVVFLKALPGSWANALARAGNSHAWQSVWVVITNPLVAWIIHAAALWVWHAPALMDAVIENEWVHAAQHLSFFLSALLFWWAVIYGRQRALGYGMAVLYMFTTALHSGLLGVLLAVSRKPWYPPYEHTTQAWGMTPEEDQQLGGLIMWIPAGVVYIIAGLALLAAWLREAEIRVNKRAVVAGATTLLLLLMIGGCEKPLDDEYAKAQTHGDAYQGREKLQYYGCTSCHTIPGVKGADAHVGPPLEHIAMRAYIGTGLTNTPPNMIQWIQHPRDIDHKAAMPNLNVSENDARDMACYLYILR